MSRFVFDAQKLQEVFDAVNTGICVLECFDDGMFRFVMINPASQRLFGLSAGEVLGKPLGDIAGFLDAKKIETFHNNLRLAQTSEHSVYYEENIGPPGKSKWLLLTMMPTRQPAGEPARIILSFHPIDDRKHAESQLKKLSVAVEQNFSAIYITDAKGTIEYANAAFYRMTGYGPEDIIGQNPRIMKSGQLSGEYYQNMWQKLAKGDVWHGEFPNLKRDGQLYWESAVISPIKDDEGVITHYVSVMEDITKLKEAQEQLQQIAATDSLTEVYNRRMGIALLHKQVAMARRDSTRLSIAFVDLDGLKEVNDKHGHSAGDSFIIHISRSIRENIRDADSLCRMGGDEFMVIFPNCAADLADRLMQRVQAVVSEDLNSDSRFAGRGFSFGVAEYPFNAKSGHPVASDISIDDFISRADQKMYQQKRNKPHRATAV